jgi:hypothetical protein
MAYFEDLSEYMYQNSARRPGTKNVGWLGLDHPFDRGVANEDDLGRVWNYCKISVAQMRGLHDCEFCSEDCNYTDRHGETLLLGTSEIRVFGSDGTIYAAPTLIYHYMSVHLYKPPEEFIRALRDGPAPPSHEYFDHLSQAGLEWQLTSAPAQKPVRFRFNPKANRLLKE